MGLRRPYIRPVYHYLPAPVGGWNPDAHPWELPENQAYQLDNLLPRPGKVVMRGGIFPTYDTSGTITAPLNVMGFVTGGADPLSGGSTWTLIPRSTVPGTDAVDTIWARGSLTLTQASTSAVFAFGPSPTSLTLASRDAVPGPRWVNYGGLIYALGFDAAGSYIQDSNATYSIPPTKLMTWPAYLSSSPTITLRTSAPQGALDVIGYQSRVWLLSGADTPAGSAVHKANTLYFTIPGGSGIGAAVGDWRDPITAATNFITIDTDLSDAPVGLARVRNGLLIFRRNSIYILRGSAPSNYQIVKVASEVGCIDQRSILETDTGVYFLSLKGLMVTDGIAVKNVSGSVMNTLKTACLWARGGARLSSPQFGYATTALLPSGSIMVSIGEKDSSFTGGLQPLFSAVLDRNTNTWWRFTSNAFLTEQNIAYAANPYPGMLWSTKNPTTAVSIGNTKLIDLTEIEDVGRGGTVSIYDSLDPLVGSTHYVAIPANWTTKMLPITDATSRVISTSKALYLDYAFSYASSPPPQGWQVQVLNANRAAVGPPLTTALSSGGTTGGGWVSGLSNLTTPEVQRQEQDNIFDIVDSWMTVSFSDATTRTAPPLGATAELYGVGISTLPGPDEPLT